MKNDLITNKLSRVVDILIDIQKEIPVIKINPPIEYVMTEVCNYYETNINDLQSKSRKRNLVYARMIFARVLMDIYKIKKNDRKFKITHKIAEKLSCSVTMATKYLLNDNKMWFVNKDCQVDITYLSTMIYWKYINHLESEKAIEKLKDDKGGQGIP